LTKIQALEKPSNPPCSPFSKGGKIGIFYRRHSEKISSLWKREAGRDLGEDLFKNSIDTPLGICKLSRRSGGRSTEISRGQTVAGGESKWRKMLESRKGN
jgi:hypothetical protein